MIAITLGHFASFYASRDSLSTTDHFILNSVQMFLANSLQVIMAVSHTGKEEKWYKLNLSTV